MGIRFNQLAADAKTRVREVSAAEASQEQAQGAVLIDVREADEFENGHAKGAIHLSKGVVELRNRRSGARCCDAHHLLLRRRFAVGAGGRQFAKDGLHQCRLDGGRVQGVEK